MACVGGQPNDVLKAGVCAQHRDLRPQAGVGSDGANELMAGE